MLALTVNDSLLRQSILNPADHIALSVRSLPSVTVAGRIILLHFSFMNRSGVAWALLCKRKKRGPREQPSPPCHRGEAR